MRDAARRCGVAVTTVTRAVVHQRATGSLERKPIPGCPRRSGTEQEALLRARLEAAPAATVLEHGAWWAEHQGQHLSEATMWRAIRRLGWTPRHWQPASVTSKRVPPGGKPLPRATPRSSSLSTKAAPIPR
jgi:transposase